MKKFIGFLLVCLMTALIVFQGKIYDKIDGIIQASGEDGAESDREEVIYREKEDDTHVYKNAWIKKIEDDDIVIWQDKESISIPLPIKADTEKLKDQVLADITVRDGEVSMIQYKNVMVMDKTAREVTDEVGHGVESDSYGRIETTGDFESIKLYDDEKQGNRYIVFEGDKACAVIEYEKEQDITVGVVIKDNSYSECIHNKIIISSNKNINCMEKKAKKITFEMKENEAYVSIGGTGSKLKAGEEISLECEGNINIDSLKRAKGIGYPGSFKVYCEKEGFVLVNYPDLEEYIKCVVSGEMPGDFDEEALKAQAVCARTFIMKLMTEGGGKYEKYNAYVDDSTSYQVYNFKKRNEKSDKAVMATKGKTLKYKDEYAKVFYYSTSCGYTANAADVFGEEYDYLTANLQNGEDYKTAPVMKVSDLSVSRMNMNFDNKSFKTFLNLRDKYPERDCPWFSWNVTIKYETIAKALNESGIYDVGKVTKVNISERKRGGIVTGIDITCDDGECKVNNQYNIRKILTPVDSKIYRNDDNVVEKMSMLPSAFFYIENKDEKCVIHGGGYGHGVGMSQYGANEMAKKGADYEEILMYYFNGTDIVKD